MDRVRRHVKECRQEVVTGGFWRDVFCEVLATSFLLSVNCAADLTWGHPDVQGGRMLPTLVMGFTVAGLVEIFGTLGGAHMNPSVSVAMVVAGNMTVLKALIYSVAQCIGATAGTLLIYWMVPPEFRGPLSVTSVRAGVTVWQGLVSEIWVTSYLLFAIHASSNEGRRPVYMNTVIIGMAVFTGGSTGSQFAGGSMNPARSFGPALVMGRWENHWIYWVGPTAGAVIATVLYLYVLDRVDHPSKVDKSKDQTSLTETKTPYVGTENHGFIMEEYVCTNTGGQLETSHM